MNDESTSTPIRLSRRGVLAASGAALAGIVGGYAVGSRAATSPEASKPSALTPTPPGPSPAPTPAADVTALSFHGPHQPGIESAPALLQTFIGLDLARDSREEAAALMRLVTDDAARLMAGEPVLGDPQPELATQPDGLTVTVGLGPTLFERLDLMDRRPAVLDPLPAFRTDALEEPWGQTDLLIQVGSNDALALAHAIRVLLRDVSALANLRWLQSGFRSPAPANPGGRTTRNLMGQVDGTINPEPGTPDFDTVVWIDDGPDWVRGGTVLVLRRIRMLMDAWDILDRQTQEIVIGRHLDTGAPLGREHETDPVPFDATDELGLPVIAADAHVRVAHAATLDETILRRPYSYDDGLRRGVVDQGLLFAAYLRDPRRSFIPMQRRIAESDAFNAWNTTVGSASYLIPPGVAPGHVLAEGLLA